MLQYNSLEGYSKAQSALTTVFQLNTVNNVYLVIYLFNNWSKTEQCNQYKPQ